jgi:hypothetical protein
VYAIARVVCCEIYLQPITCHNNTVYYIAIMKTGYYTTLTARQLNIVMPIFRVLVGEVLVLQLVPQLATASLPDPLETSSPCLL